LPCERFSAASRGLYRWLLRLVGDEALAKNLLSEVFSSHVVAGDRFEGRSSSYRLGNVDARFKALSRVAGRTEAELDEKIETTVADPANDPEAALQVKNRGDWCAKH